MYGYAVDLVAFIGDRACFELEVYDEVANCMRYAGQDLNTPIRWGGAWQCNNICAYDGMIEDLQGQLNEIKNSFIGEGTKIGPHVVIQGPTKIGAHNEIHAFSSIGADSQDKKFHGEIAYLEIGDHNIFREYTSVHRGTKDGGSITKIGHHNLFMNYVHIAHDCIIGSHNTLSNNATRAGHVHLGDYITMGGFSAVHQFVKIGDHAFVAGRCGVYMDVIPYVLVGGDQGHLLGLNTIGLKRRHFSLEDINKIHLPPIALSLFYEDRGQVLESLKAIIIKTFNSITKKVY